MVVEVVGRERDIDLLVEGEHPRPVDRAHRLVQKLTRGGRARLRVLALEAREFEQPVRERRQAADGVLGADDLGAEGIGVAEVVVGELQLGAQGGERGSQFVRRIRDHPPLAQRAVVHPVQEIVECDGEGGELVVRSADREAFVLARSAQRLGPASHRGDGPQGEGGEKPRRRREGEQGEYASDDE